MAAHLTRALSVLSNEEQEKAVVPAMLLHIDAEIAYRQAQARADWARSRPAPRPEAARPAAARELGRRAARLLHLQPLA